MSESFGLTVSPAGCAGEARRPAGPRLVSLRNTLFPRTVLGNDHCTGGPRDKGGIGRGRTAGPGHHGEELFAEGGGRSPQVNGRAVQGQGVTGQKDGCSFAVARWGNLWRLGSFVGFDDRVEQVGQQVGRPT